MTTLANFRPRTALEIVDGTFTLFREHFLTLVAISAIVGLPSGILAILVPEDMASTVDRLGNLLIPLGQAAMAVVIYRSLSGLPTSLGASFKEIKASYGTLLLIQILTGLLVIVGLVLLVIPGVLVFVWTAVAIPAAAIEGLATTPALNRSRDLVRSSGWHVFRTMLLTFGIMAVLILAGSVAFGFAGGAIGLGDRAIGFLSTIVYILVFPMSAVAATLLYVDLRVRREALDVEATLDLLAASSPVPAEQL